MRSVQMRAVRSTNCSNAVQGAELLDKKQLTINSHQQAARISFLHLRGKSRDSAVNDTHNGGMLHDMA